MDTENLPKYLMHVNLNFSDFEFSASADITSGPWSCNLLNAVVAAYRCPGGITSFLHRFSSSHGRFLVLGIAPSGYTAGLTVGELCWIGGRSAS